MGAYVGQGVEGRGVGDGRDREWRRGMGDVKRERRGAERRGPGSQVSQWGGTHDVLHGGRWRGLHTIVTPTPWAAGQPLSPSPQVVVVVVLPTRGRSRLRGYAGRTRVLRA